MGILAYGIGCMGNAVTFQGGWWLCIIIKRWGHFALFTLKIIYCQGNCLWFMSLNI